MSDTTLKTPATAIVEASAVKPAPAMNGEAPTGPKRRAKNPIVLVLEVVGSLKLTVTLFALSLVLVFFGTLAQIDSGIWTVVGEYFRSFYVFIKLQLLVQFGQVFFGLPKSWTLHGAFPFPGGWTIGGVLLVNIVAAYALRVPGYLKRWPSYTFMAAVIGINLIVGYLAAVTLSEWQFLTALGTMVVVNIIVLIPCHKFVFFPGNRIGIFTTHIGIVLMIVGEFITGVWAVEGYMSIKEGETTKLVVQNRVGELAFKSDLDAENESVTVIPGRFLKNKGTITHDDLPVDVEIVKWMVNARIQKLNEEKGNPATKGDGLQATAVDVGEVSGVDTKQTADAPAMYARLKDKTTGEDLGVYLFSLLLDEQDITINGKLFRVKLRFKESRKPYSLRLEKFTFDRYPGTNTPKNFASRVTLLDEERGDNREVTISMNKPLRHRGDTFFQADWDKDTEKGTVLQVVKNPAWQLPYWSCAIVSVGLLLHFVLNLINFLARGASE